MKVYYISINYSVEDELGSSKFWVQQNIFIVSWCTGLVLRLSSTDLSQSFLCKVLPIYMYIRLCHLFMFDQAYYRSSILSMSLCIVSFFLKNWTTRVHLPGILREIICLFLYSSKCKIHVFFVKRKMFSISMCMVYHYKCVCLY